MDYDELIQVAEDMYANEIPYSEWRHNRTTSGFQATVHLYAQEMVSFWGDPGLGEEQVALDADERDIVVNMIEAKAREERGRATETSDICPDCAGQGMVLGSTGPYGDDPERPCDRCQMTGRV